MMGRLKDCCQRTEKRRRYKSMFYCLPLLFLIILAAGCSLTKEKAEEISSEEVRKENEGCMDMSSNPLTFPSSSEITEAVNAYYTQLAEETDFVEAYHNVRPFTKMGKYKDSYVVFVYYDMKIKDIFTEVPGLETLYMEKQEDGSFSIQSTVDESEIQKYIETIASHEDVQELMSQVETNYAAALASDALLTEALKDLQNAYENPEE